MGFATANECNSIIGTVKQLVQNERVYCQYTDAATGFGIVFAILGAILMVGGFISKEQTNIEAEFGIVL